MISQIYEIYSLPNYSYVLEKNDKGSNIAERFSSKSYKKIIEELYTSDKQYHLLVRKDDMLKLNIDIDGMKRKKLPTFFKRISKYFASIGVDVDIIVSYTSNKNGKKNVETKTQKYVYSHITFTNLCATSSKQKEFWEGFI